MFLSPIEFSRRQVSFYYDGELITTEVVGDFVCECINANSPSSYQDHVDLTWDYYTYRTDQITNGIVHPSVAPDGQTNQTYAVSPNGLNQYCWINTLFGNSSKPNFPQSATNRSFGASYFDERFYPSIDCDGDYDEPCFTDPSLENQLRIEIYSICDGGIDKARKKIGLYPPGQSTVTFISPTHATFCAHCLGDGAQTTQSIGIYNPTTQTVQNILVDLYPINYNQYTQRLRTQRDIRIGKIQTAGVTFPNYYQYYLNPFSFKEYIQYSRQNLYQNLAAFMVNANGLFVLWYFPFSTFNSLSQFNVETSYETPIISGKYSSLIKNIIQPKNVTKDSGDSGTNFMYFSKTGINVWPVGARDGQYLQECWKLFNGRYAIDDINDFLSLVGEPTLTEFIDYDNLYKIEDFVPRIVATEASMKVNTKKFNKKFTVQANSYTLGSAIKKVKIQKEVVVERHYK